jgi:hypothetical protein
LVATINILKGLLICETLLIVITFTKPKGFSIAKASHFGKSFFMPLYGVIWRFMAF